MMDLRMLYHMARADFLERARRHSFLVLLIATAFLGYLFVPPLDAQYQTVTLGNARGVYNSPWIGAMFGLMISTTAPLIAFYLINNAIGHDRRSRVGEIIACTQVGKTLYVLGKWLSNIAVLVPIMLMLTLVAVGMQLFRAEDLHIELWAVVTPIWLIGFPVMVVTAAVAVLFESIPFLNGGFGNIIYFFTWILILAAVIAPLEDNANSLMGSSNDFYGISRTISAMQHTILHYDPDYSGDFSIGGFRFSSDPLLFHWKGLAWTPALIWERLSWLLVGPVILIVAALVFDRFDPAKVRALRKRKHCRDAVADNVPGVTPQRVDEPAIPIIPLTPLPNRRYYGRFTTVLHAELRLVLRAQSRWWYLVAAVLVIASFAAPPDATHIPLAFAWLWPILVWSPMGVREARYFTHELVFSVPRPLRQQLVATWLAGVVVALLMSSGGLVCALSTGNEDRALIMGVGIVFVPSLALACGVLSRRSRLFEVLYLILWYVAFNGVAAFDFMGLGNASVQQGYWLIYLVLALLSLVGSIIGRRSQMQC
jgi:hypothetical protein